MISHLGAIRMPRAPSGVPLGLVLALLLGSMGSTYLAYSFRPHAAVVAAAVPLRQCLGVTRKGVRCRNVELKSLRDGFCAIHQWQRPKAR